MKELLELLLLLRFFRFYYLLSRLSLDLERCDLNYLVFTLSLILIISLKDNFFDFCRFLFLKMVFSFIIPIHPQSNLTLHSYHLIEGIYLEVLMYNVWLVVKEVLFEHLQCCSQSVMSEDYNVISTSQLLLFRSKDEEESSF